jgi:hypothetical protein
MLLTLVGDLVGAAGNNFDFCRSRSFQVQPFAILRFSFFRCSSLPSPGGIPSLRPALHPAFKVRRGRRSLCAAMRRHAPPIRIRSPRDFRSACRRTGLGSWLPTSIRRLSPQRTLLFVSVWQRGAQSLHVRRTPKPEVLLKGLKVPSYAPRGDSAQSKLAAGSGRFERLPRVLVLRNFLRDVSTVLVCSIVSFRLFGICEISILEFLDFCRSSLPSPASQGRADLTKNVCVISAGRCAAWLRSAAHTSLLRPKLHAVDVMSF